MHAHQESYFDAEDMEHVTTEVFFSNLEGVYHDRLAAAIEGNPDTYDQEVFPERIVLLGKHSKDDVIRMMAGGEASAGKVDGRVTEKIEAENYL